MRPESCDYSQASGTRLQTPTLIGCILLKNFALCARLTFVQRRDGIMRCFANPCQALGFPSSPESAALGGLTVVCAVNFEAHDYSIVFARRQKNVGELD